MIASRSTASGSRRDLATRKAGWAVGLARWLGATGVRPNEVSIAGTFFAVVAGTAFYLSADGVGSDPFLLLLAAGCIQLRLLCNLLDGMLAIEEGLKTKMGELFNDLPDRIEDIVILAGAGYSIRSLVYGVALGWAAAVLAVLTAYIRVLGASLGTSQLFLGPMAKQHRMFALTVFTLLAAAESSMALPLRALHGGLAVIVAGSIFTVARRTRRIAAQLSDT